VTTAPPVFSTPPTTCRAGVAISGTRRACRSMRVRARRPGSDARGSPTGRDSAPASRPDLAVVDEARHLVDERRDQEVSEGRHSEGGESKHDANRAAAGEAASLERHCEDDGDEKLDEDPADRVDEGQEEHVPSATTRARPASWGDHHLRRAALVTALLRSVIVRLGCGAGEVVTVLPLSTLSSWEDPRRQCRPPGARFAPRGGAPWRR
jgi:hypothetical protein